jgi:hypothetical protein
LGIEAPGRKNEEKQEYLDFPGFPHRSRTGCIRVQKMTLFFVSASLTQRFLKDLS